MDGYFELPKEFTRPPADRILSINEINGLIRASPMPDSPTNPFGWIALLRAAPE